MATSDEDVSAGSILRDLILNQYQAIVLGGTALASLVTLNPLPLIVWAGTELVLLPILDSGPLRRLVSRRKLAAARARAGSTRAQVIAALTPPNAKRYQAMEQMCGLIENNYQGLTGISQAYLSEQRQKLDVILRGCLNRLMALQRYERMPVTRNAHDVEHEIESLEQELQQGDLPERAKAALQKNLELKRKLLTSLSAVDGSVKTLLTELDSMESLLEVLYQNSIALRDPQAISEELDSIVRQAEDSERVVREMESLLRDGTDGLPETLIAEAGDPVALPSRSVPTSAPQSRPKGKTR
jgi:hypothetical protein